ncbi:MAG: MBL fold metallo-hydrolase [Candidatus Metalachnospira sp.]|nr:MBL fold metallo-hydrolase [Candidatus Metalachnospira sp.]
MDNFYCVKGNTWCIDTGNTLLVAYRLNDKDIVLLDSGMSYRGGDTKFVLQALDGNNLNVKAIIATHGHIDHIGNNEVLVRKYHSKVYMYGAEAHICRDLDSLRILHSTVAYEEIKEPSKSMRSKVDYFIDPKADEIDICGEKFGIIHSPGHSMSHISIITPDNVIMVGDALMSDNEIVKAKIPYACNFAIDFRSKRMLAELNCDKYIISHRGIRDDIKEEVEFNINYLKSRAEVVLSYIEDGMCFDDIAAAVINCMNIKVGSRYYFFDIHGMIMPYVQYLEETGRVRAYYQKGYVRYEVTD